MSLQLTKVSKTHLHALKDFSAHLNDHNITQGLLTRRRWLWLWLWLTTINNHNDGLLKAHLPFVNPCGCGEWWGQPSKPQSIIGLGLGLENQLVVIPTSMPLRQVGLANWRM